MAQSSLLTALRTPRAAPVHLPLFLVPCFAGNSTSSLRHLSARSRSYANHAKMPKTKRDPLADPNASRKHLKADFPMTTRPTKRDMNRKRGVSAMRSTGPRKPLEISKHLKPQTVPERPDLSQTSLSVLKYFKHKALPEPARDYEERRKSSEFATDENHGLWGFFYDKKAMVPPEKMDEHGRAWTYQELSLKSFDDLHALYWIAHKDRNRIATNSAERTRVHAGYGGAEDEDRDNVVKETMENIRDVLRDRYESTEEALRILDSTSLAKLNLEEEAEVFEGVEER